MDAGVTLWRCYFHIGTLTFIEISTQYQIHLHLHQDSPFHHDFFKHLNHLKQESKNIFRKNFYLALHGLDNIWNKLSEGIKNAAFIIVRNYFGIQGKNC